MISIFDLEKRFNHDEQYLRIISFCNREKVGEEGYINIKYNLWGVFNKTFNTWEYRELANNCVEYLEDLGISFNMLEDCRSLEYQLLIIQFIDNIAKHSKENNVYFDYDECDNKINTLRDNIGIFLEKCNYQRYEIEDKIEYTKRDEDVDSVLPILFNEEELRLLLLEYNDFRIENNMEKKKDIIFNIGAWFEPNREKYEKINHTLTNKIFELLNKGSVRHNNLNQYILNDNDQLCLYDELFKMMLHLIRQEKINEYINKDYSQPNI